MRKLFHHLFLGLALGVLTAIGACAQSARATLVFGGHVTPHWFAGPSGQTNEFWYRLDLAKGKRKFILVNAVAGTRQPAFNQARVAKALTKLTGHDVSADHLPVESLSFAHEGRTIVLYGMEGGWKLDLPSYSLISDTNLVFNEHRLPAGRVPHPSRRTGPATEITLLNQLHQTVDLFWIDPGGRRVAYGTLVPGQRRTQPTYAGHVWLVTGRAGNVLAVFEAQARPGLAVINGHPGRGGLNRFRRGGGRPLAGPVGVSPNGQWQAVVYGNNLTLRNLATGKETQLTYDANRSRSYRRNAELARDVDMEYEAKDPAKPVPEVFWSPDSQYLVALRFHTVPTRRVYEVESSPPNQLQPILTSYPYLKAGDAIPYATPHLFDVKTQKEIPISHTLFPNPWSITQVRWDRDSSRFTFLYIQRGSQVERIVAVNAQSGAARAIVNEQSKTFIDWSGKFYCHYLDKTHEIIWMSERDGWNHLYLYNSLSGKVKNRITTGHWVVRRVDYVDPRKRQIWFEAGGIVPGQDPYYIQYCRVNFDGTGLTVLTHGDGTHTVQFSPDRRFFLDTWSRVDLPPITVLRRSSDGHLICRLEKADASALYATGWKPPLRFVAPGRDGVTKIYGLIWRPKDFDPHRKYPVIESVYAGPQSSYVPTAFHSFYRQQQLANDGFVVVQSDGMGTSNRSKKFQDVCWKNLRDAGFPDRIGWIKEAAGKYRWMNLNRVGIYGTSAGGQDALWGILDYPHFYKACVADSGCYDNRMDKIWWNEQWMGWPVGKSYAHDSCAHDAYKLQGKLLLMVGELDKNVDPSSTMQVVNALIKANKDFNLLYMPGAGHGVAETPYGWRRLQEFFEKSLLGPDGGKLDAHNSFASQRRGMSEAR